MTPTAFAASPLASCSDLRLSRNEYLWLMVSIQLSHDPVHPRARKRPPSWFNFQAIECH